MARKNSATTGSSPKRLAIGLLESVTTLWAVCAKHAARASRKLRADSTSSRVAPRSSPMMARPKQLLTKISNKAIHFRQRKKRSAAAAAAEEEEEEEFELDDGDGGLWQRTILMGDKCQPLDFSGVIYYDSNGKQLPEMPARSPRASPLPSYVYAAAAKNGGVD